MDTEIHVINNQGIYAVLAQTCLKNISFIGSTRILYPQLCLELEVGILLSVKMSLLMWR